MKHTLTESKRWLALIVLCLGSLMIVLDTTIVNIALPSIKTDLGFTDTSLSWVVNAYMLTFGGFLLLGGRLGDLFGHRKLFLIGISLFTIASVGCGVANSQLMLIVARALQGLGGAVVSAVALSLMINLFTEPAERAKAMGVFGFVNAGGGSLGVLLGGVLTGTLNWHWIFLVNVPLGILVFALCSSIIPAGHIKPENQKLDIWGALTVTASLMLAVYGIVNGQLPLLGISAVLMAIFIFMESRIKSPLVPLGLFKLRSVAVSSVVGILWAASMFAWFFISALYMQLVLKYEPLQIGLSFLPANVIMAVFSLGLSAKIVMKFGTRKPLALGMFLMAVGLGLFARAPINGQFLFDILPSMILIGFGGGVAFNPVLLTAMSEVKESESGLASGVLNTSFMMGGALGLAVLASLAASITMKMLTQATAVSQEVALTAGYHTAFLAGAIFALAAAIISIFLLKKEKISR